MGLKEAVQKYRNASVTMKATVWYTACNILQKLAAFLIIPFLTRMLTTADYGLYSFFLSWLDIIEIFATMRIYSNGYVAGLVRNNDDEDRYTCSIQIVSVITIAVCFCVFLMFSDQISHLIQIDKHLICYMFFSFFATSSIGIWSSRQRVNNRYKLMVVVTLAYSVLAPMASIVGAFYSENRLETVIVVRVVTQFVISIPFFIMNVFGKNKSVVRRYCKGALKYNFPLVPYYLSMVLLNNSDRIMIKTLAGNAEAGIYSVAYSLSMAMFVFVGALNLSLQPWLFNKIKNNKADGADKTISMAVLFIAVMNTCVLIVAPELIRIVASAKYAAAVWTMPPIIASLLVMFVYQQILQVPFYYGENNVVFIASVASAVLNIVLNFICIPRFGYIAAGYTTLISYMFIAVLYYVSMVKVAKKHGLDYRNFYNIRYILIVFAAFCVMSAFVMLLYPHPLARYILVALMLIILVRYRKSVMDIFGRKSMNE